MFHWNLLDRSEQCSHLSRPIKNIRVRLLIRHNVYCKNEEYYNKSIAARETLDAPRARRLE
jgi:hypothetical protein